MKKKIFVIFVALLAVAMLATPAMAAKPTVMDEDVWFVWSLSGGATTGNDVTWTGDGTILHNHATYKWNLMRSPTTTGTVQIGTVVTESNLVFNTVTGEGNLLIKATLNFTESNTVKNPYGVGILECTAVAKVTSMNTRYPLVFGDGAGFIVGANGSGAFENAKLTADLVLGPIPKPPASAQTEGIFFGVHERVNGEGTIVYHNPGK